jgi:G3E family GTPase
VVGQAEFADVAALNRADPFVAAALRRLSPRARIHVGADGIEHALGNLFRGARRGESDDPHGPLLAGQPPLDSRGPINLVEFNARRPFHPQRLHDCLDLLLEGVIRTRGRLWLASQPEQAMWLESAGCGLRVSSAGKWLAALTDSELADIDAERRAFAELAWDDQYGDRHTAMTVLVCGADANDILDALGGALLTDEEFRFPRDWIRYADPFGDWHEDPCAARGEAAENPPAHRGQDGDRR